MLELKLLTHAPKSGYRLPCFRKFINLYKQVPGTIDRGLYLFNYITSRSVLATFLPNR